ncbi:MAG TPA: globin [Acidimicrobiales bacterium]|jgi:hemoglobin|nr:globin [Acidimicrobiales bacterium]
MSDGVEDIRGPTVYQLVGGQPFFDDLVARFYGGVAGDATLRPLYPEEDLSGAEHRLALFLGQYWGGPTTYSDERGHPRLRMRHLPFVVGERERDAWLAHMTAALDGAATAHGVAAEVRDRMAQYFAMAADAMVNAR